MSWNSIVSMTPDEYVYRMNRRAEKKREEEQLQHLNEIMDLYKEESRHNIELIDKAIEDYNIIMRTHEIEMLKAIAELNITLEGIELKRLEYAKKRKELEES